MEVTSHSNVSDFAESGANTTMNESECVKKQPAASGSLPLHGTEDTPPFLSDRSEDGDISDDSLTDVSRLLPTQPASDLRKHTGGDSSSLSLLPVCTPPTSTLPSPHTPPPSAPPHSRLSTCSRHTCSLPYHKRHHNSSTQKHLSSTRSHASLKTDAAHIKEVAGDDCCIHCLLACLFCELPSMCSAVGECLSCGVGGAGCCGAAVGGCGCVEAAGEAACTGDACQALLDCGILEDCCGSSECLEICLECCSICFPS